MSFACPGPAAIGLRLAALGALALPAAPAFARQLAQGAGVEVPIWRILGALIFCLALAVVAALVLKRRMSGPNPLAFGRARRLALVESLRLSHQVDLCIVSCDGGELLIASTPHGATLIDASRIDAGRAPLVPAPPKEAE